MKIKYYDLIASRMLLNTVLYSMSALSQHDERVKELIKGHELTIRVGVEAGPSRFLEVKNDLMYFDRNKIIEQPDVELCFTDPNDFFTFLRKDTNIDLHEFTSTGKVTIKGPESFKPNLEKIVQIAIPFFKNILGEDIPHEDELALVKILIYAYFAGFEEITDEDENVQFELKGMNLIIQMSVKNGPKCFFHFKDGTFSGHMDQEHPNPTVTIEFSDLKTTRKVLSGTADISKLYFKEKIKIDGDYTKAMKLMSIRELVMEYQDYIKAKRRA